MIDCQHWQPNCSSSGECDCLRWEHPSIDCRKGGDTTIPIVFLRGRSSPVGLVASLNRPGSNVTGVATLRRINGKATRAAARVGPYGDHNRRACQPDRPRFNRNRNEKSASSGPNVGPYAPLLHASTEQEIDTAFMTLVQLRAGGLVIGPDSYFNSRSEQLAVLTLRYAIPAIYNFVSLYCLAG